MRLLILSIFILFLTLENAGAARPKLSTFQRILVECTGADFTGEKISTLKKLYEMADQKFELQSTLLIDRETYFSQAGQNKKLKFEYDRWSVSKVLDDGTYELINSGSRQKKPAIEVVLGDLLLNAKITSDRTKLQEIRAGQRKLVITRTDHEIRALQYRKASSEKSLDCVRNSKADICSCQSAI